MTSIAQMVQEHNNLIDASGINAKKVDTFPDRKTAEDRLKKLKNFIANKNGLPTSKDLTPKGRTEGFIQDRPVVTREEAVAGGLVLYWPGYPCDNGHNAVRYAKTGVCKKCYQMFRDGSIDQKMMSRDHFKKKGKNERSNDRY